MADNPIDVLSAALADPDLADRHEEIRAALSRRMPVGVGAPDPHAPPPPHENTFGERMASGVERLKGAIEPVARVANQAADRTLNAGTLGLWGNVENTASRLSGHQVGPSPAEKQDFQENHPWIAGTADAIGYISPEGAPGRIGSSVGRGVDALTNAVAKRGAARVAAKTLGGAATGSATAGLVRGSEAVSRGADPIKAGSEALDAAASPYAWALGAGMGAAGGVAGEAARAARESSPDLSILHKYGLEPGPVPGRPVIRQDHPIHSQLPGMSEPPLGVSRATPATRGAASRAAADAIVPDMAERSYANNQRFGEMRQEAVAREGQNPAHVRDTINLIDQHINDPGMPDTTRAALGKLRERIINQSTPTRAGSFVKADDLDRLRDYADSLGKQERAAKASDVPLRQVADMMRQSVGEAAPGLAKLNAQQAEVLSGFEQRRATLGVPRLSERGSGTSEKTLQSVAGKIQQSGEETATGGRSTVGGKTRSERLAELGAPPTLPGTQVPPEPTYGAHLDVPRLQLAQENLQLTPSKVFSGAGQPVTSGAGVAHRLAHAAPTRLLYPLARRAGDASVAAKPVAADALIQALRGRRDKSMTNWQTDEQGVP